MPRPAIRFGREALPKAGEALSTTAASATVNAALREAARRRALPDFDVQRDIDGSPAEVAQGRAARAADEP